MPELRTSTHVPHEADTAAVCLLLDGRTDGWTSRVVDAVRDAGIRVLVHDGELGDLARWLRDVEPAVAIVHASAWDAIPEKELLALRLLTAATGSHNVLVTGREPQESFGELAPHLLELGIDHLVLEGDLDLLVLAVRRSMRCLRVGWTDPRQTWALGNLVVRRSSFSQFGSVFVDGREVNCTAGEWQLLESLIESHPAILSIRAVEHLWGERIIRSMANRHDLIYRLRRRLKRAGCDVTIKNVRGVGYKLAIPP